MLLPDLQQYPLPQKILSSIFIISMQVTLGSAQPATYTRWIFQFVSCGIIKKCGIFMVTLEVYSERLLSLLCTSKGYVPEWVHPWQHRYYLCGGSTVAIMEHANLCVDASVWIEKSSVNGQMVWCMKSQLQTTCACHWF